MAERPAQPAAEGEIETGFMITGHGWVLTLKEGFSGAIKPGGIVESDLGRAAYTGPELGYRRSNGAVTGFVGVMIDSEFKELFPPGQRVRFYDRS